MGYADLFEQFPNAHQKDDEALRTYFTVNSDTGKDAVSRMVQTFKTFVEFADFDSIKGSPPRAKGHAEKGVEKKEREEALSKASTHSVPSVAINIQLQVPSDPSGEIYDKFFAAMAKHLPLKHD